MDSYRAVQCFDSELKHSLCNVPRTPCANERDVPIPYVLRGGAAAGSERWDPYRGVRARAGGAEVRLCRVGESFVGRGQRQGRSGDLSLPSCAHAEVTEMTPTHASRAPRVGDRRECNGPV